ncbi:LegC family aminotransferase [Paenibacillus hodogayensis]|uniref:LegC family aminotransferase n=1 Tax=Paenibacillus hodogayensis TaxID=279208 RepID=A0ABV5W4R6_9BACL
MSRRLRPEALLVALQSALPDSKETIALHEPRFSGNEWAYVKECLDTGWVSSAGRFVDRFEERLADYTGASYAVAVSTGTAALHIALILAGVQPDDEVIVPSLTFVATANAVRYCGAVPHFADVEYATLGLDPHKLRRYLHEIAEVAYGYCYNKQTGRRIKAVVPMHTFGHPVDLDPLAELCGLYRLELVEDAAESLGSFYKGRHTGTFGKLAAFSFNGNKIITTGGGGAIVTNDAELARQAKHLTTTAKTPHPWAYVHDRVGFNYRLPNLNAALGCAQLEQLDAFVAGKRKLARRYETALGGIKGVGLFREPGFARSNYWLNTLLLDEPQLAARDEVLELLNAHGIMCRPAWVPMHKLPMFANSPKDDLAVTDNLERRMINIPSSVYLGAGDAKA